MTSLTELLYYLLLVTLTPYLAVIFVVKILPENLGKYLARIKNIYIVAKFVLNAEYPIK